MKEVRGIDIDEVKFETVDAVLAFHDYKINNRPFTRNDITNYHMHRIPDIGLDLQTACQRWADFMQSPKVHDIKPVQYANEVLKILQAQGKEFIDITGRRTERKTRTQAAQDKYYPNIATKIIYLDAYKHVDQQASTVQQITQRKKSEICKEFGVKVMVEDDMEYALDLADNAIKVYLLSKPRNQQYQNGMHPMIIKVDTRLNILREEIMK